jgi:hypothetical protein
MRRLALLVLLPMIVAPAVGAPAPFFRRAREARSDILRFQGRWRTAGVYLWRNGDWCAADLAFVVVVSGTTVKWHVRDTLTATEAVTLFPGSRSVDVKDVRTGKTLLGNYAFSGETLTITTADPGQPRPASVDQGALKIVLRR